MNIKLVLARNNTFLNKISYYTPAVCWGIFISVGTLSPEDEIPVFLISLNDKLIHATIYFLASGLIFLGYVRYNLKNQIPLGFLICVLLLCILYGGLIEILQYYLVPGRTGDWNDFIANSTGALISALLFLAIRKRAA